MIVWRRGVYMTMGNDTGQMSNIFLAGVPSVQMSRRLRQRGDPNTADRHLRHTGTSLSQFSYCIPGTRRNRTLVRGPRLEARRL
jgi:hypothetical protein